MIVHAHFYQPPRDNPWTGRVEREVNAAPWHDWNERIERECYGVVAAARLTTTNGETRATRNLYQDLSFDFGPTLLEWLAENAKDTYRAILEADAASVAALGRGNAIATPYHHVILPLASRRDKITEVEWGIRDFRDRFGRDPEGMWLPETAVDMETLDVLAEAGIQFTIVAPHQVSETHRGLPSWIRTTRRGDRTMVVFPYDGGLSHDVAFGPLIKDAVVWADRMLTGGDGGEDALVALATDGETYGHHHVFGEMALAALVERLEMNPEVQITNFAAYLAKHPPPPERTTMLVENTSWSCPHGIERWRLDCGCRTEDGTSQAWRAPLRDALDWLRDQLEEKYPPPNMPGEMQRHALRMFTSCGWFFDDVAGLETLICLRSAARAIELAQADSPRLLAGFRERLSIAVSNDPVEGNGADIFDRHVWSSRPGPVNPS